MLLFFSYVARSDSTREEYHTFSVFSEFSWDAKRIALLLKGIDVLVGLNFTDDFIKYTCAREVSEFFEVRIGHLVYV